MAVPSRLAAQSTPAGGLDAAKAVKPTLARRATRPSDQFGRIDAVRLKHALRGMPRARRGHGPQPAANVQIEPEPRRALLKPGGISPWNPNRGGRSLHQSPLL